MDLVSFMMFVRSCVRPLVRFIPLFVSSSVLPFIYSPIRLFFRSFVLPSHFPSFISSLRTYVHKSIYIYAQCEKDREKKKDGEESGAMKKRGEERIWEKIGKSSRQESVKGNLRSIKQEDADLYLRSHFSLSSNVISDIFSREGVVSKY